MPGNQNQNSGAAPWRSQHASASRVTPYPSSQTPQQRVRERGSLENAPREPHRGRTRAQARPQTPPLSASQPRASAASSPDISPAELAVRKSDNNAWLSEQQNLREDQLEVLTAIAPYTDQEHFKKTLLDLQTGKQEYVQFELRRTPAGLLDDLANVTAAAERNPVTFSDIPCFVFAFAGFKHSDHANSVNEACDKFGFEVRLGQHDVVNSVLTEQDSRMVQLRKKLETECADIQIFTRDGAPVPITIYGEFGNKKGNGRFGIPDHAWIECNNFIFETFPNQGLQGQPATDISRRYPDSLRLGNVSRDSFTVGSYAAFLTLAQAHDIGVAYPNFIPNGDSTPAEDAASSGGSPAAVPQENR